MVCKHLCFTNETRLDKNSFSIFENDMNANNTSPHFSSTCGCNLDLADYNSCLFSQLLFPRVLCLTVNLLEVSATESKRRETSMGGLLASQVNRY